MRSIKLVNQPTPTSCTSACLAMVTGLDVHDIIAEFHDDWHSQKTNPAEFLKSKGFEFVTNTNPFSNIMKWGKVYLLSVASLNIQGGLHHIIADMRGDQEVILDPNNGKDGKKFYTGWSEKSENPLAVELRAWMVDGEVLVL